MLPINLDIATQVQPYFVYNRVALGAPRAYVLYTIPHGFNFLLRRVVTQWPEAFAATAADVIPHIEFFCTSDSRPRQVAPVRLPLISSPGGGRNATMVASGAPLGFSLSASSRRSVRIVNQAYVYNDTIRCEITGQNPAVDPVLIDVVLEGVLIPERALAIWRGRGDRRGGA